LTALEQLAVAATCLSGCAEIFYFSSSLLTNIPAVSGQSAFVPIVVWAAAVFLIAVAANRSRRATGTASPDAAGYLRTLGLITYLLYLTHLYLTHNVIGSAIVRVLMMLAWMPPWLYGWVWACLSWSAGHLREDGARR
jgi:hypothetical protein